MRKLASSDSKASRGVAFYMPSIGPLLNPTEAVPAAGGAETQIMLVARELARDGMRVAIMVDADPGLPARFDGVDVVQLPPWARLTDLRIVGKLLGFGGLLVTLARLRPSTLVQRMGSSRTGWCAAGARLTGARFVWSSASRTDFSPEATGKSERDIAMLRYGVKRADAVVVQTDEQARLCRDAYSRDAVVIRSIAESLHAKRAKSCDAIWIGRAASYKRPDAFVDLAESLPDLRFRMVLAVGAETNRTELDELTKRVAALPNIEVLGAQPRSVVVGLVAESRVLVNTSTDEGMPNVFLEAWSLGVPTITLHHDPDEIIATHDLGGFAEGSPERLSEITQSLCSNDELMLTTMRACASYVRGNHDPLRVAAQWRDLLLSTAG